MQTSLTKFIAYMFLFLSIAACRQIESDDRWIPEAENRLPATERSTVLIEEYTGQNCINCPGAAAELKKISQDYPGNVITVSMHANRTGQVREELASSDADTYAGEYHIPASVPGILINRRKSDGEKQYIQKKALWNSLIRQAVNTPYRYRIELKADRTADKKFDIRVSVSSSKERNSSETLGIQLWAVEDIRAEQMLPTGKKEDYLHHNVLRGTLNGISGVEYTLGEVYQLQTSLPPTVKDANHAKIIAFVFERRTNEVFEAAILPLGSGIQPDEKDEAERPEYEGSENLSFRVGDQTIVSGSTIRAEQTEAVGTVFEVISPLIYVVPGKQKDGNYILEIRKEDHTGASFGGLSQICADGQCQDSPDTEVFTKESYEPNQEDFIQIHYKIAPLHIKKKDDYRVRLSLHRNGKEVAHLHIVFGYDPEKRSEEQPQPPLPEAPVPSPPVSPSPSLPRDHTRSNVLIMDYTGQRCPACTYYIGQLAALEKEYQPHVTVVAIHNRSYNVDTNFIFNQWYDYAAGRITGYPTFLFNNRINSKNLPWQVKALVEKTPSLFSELKASRKNRSVELSFKATTLQGKESELANRSLNVLFWITENNLKGFQTGKGTGFVHNHILRGYLNGLWGEQYTMDTTVTLTKELPEKVRSAEHCELIAIVLDANTTEFIDAVKVKL